jgi:2,4-dienoyl-CoA reductase-like NADH-dependent reductase (Old Yellow Enzyme family)
MPATPPDPLAHPNLWQPIEIAGRSLQNRLAVAPMSRVSTLGDGVPTRQMRDYYQDFAAGGFGLVITEGTYPIGPAAQGYANQPALITDEQVDGWRSVVQAVHDSGALIIAQLMHAGALSQFLPRTLGPSVHTPQGKKLSEYGGSGPYPTPAEMTEAQITEVVAGFAASAALAAKAGFDGVEIHAANGYLLDQFITDYTNTRTDSYGGGPHSRARLAAQVLTAVRDSTDERFIVGLRLSQAKVNDSRYKWRDEHEATALLQTVTEASPDYVHLAGEGRPWTQSGRTADGTALGPLARAVTGRPVIVNGGLHEPALANEVLASGQADLVSIGRGALADPHWPAKIRSGAATREFTSDMITPSASVQNTIDFLERAEDPTRTAP